MYKSQVSLLLAVIEEALSDERVALKGGTAINLFFENMPRFSVDIDLCYLPIKPREDSLIDIDSLMNDMAVKIDKNLQLQIQINKTPDGLAKQILVQSPKAYIKIEINHVLRGCVYPTQTLTLCQKAQDEFKTYVEVRGLSYEDVFAGKFCAALDRQHPRDLFDVMNFYKNNVITDKLKKA